MRDADLAIGGLPTMMTRRESVPSERAPRARGDDHALAERALAGDADAFGVLVERYAPVARRVARAILGHPEDADDAAQDGFLLAWRKLEQYDPARPFRPWLLKIVANAARDLRRGRRVRATEPLDSGLAAAGPGPAEDTEAALLAGRLARALGALPERQRVAVVLFDAEGYPHAEIAEIMGIPEGTVRSLVFHGRRALRKTLSPIKRE